MLHELFVREAEKETQNILQPWIDLDEDGSFDSEEPMRFRFGGQSFRLTVRLLDCWRCVHQREHDQALQYAAFATLNRKPAM